MYTVYQKTGNGVGKKEGMGKRGGLFNIFIGFSFLFLFLFFTSYFIFSASESRKGYFCFSCRDH